MVVFRHEDETEDERGIPLRQLTIWKAMIVQFYANYTTIKFLICLLSMETRVTTKCKWLEHFPQIRNINRANDCVVLWLN